MRKLRKVIICFVLIISTVLMPVVASAKTMRVLSVTGENVRLRESSEDGAQVISKLKKGTQLLYLGQNVGGRCKVMTSSGKIGYVYKSYLESHDTLESERICIAKVTAPIYKRVGNKLRRSGSITKGRFLYIEKVENGWARAKTTSGKTCYIKTKYIQKVSLNGI